MMVGVLGCRFGGGGWVMGLPVLWWWQWVANLAVECCGDVVVWVGALLTPSFGV